jgi:aspartate kinase
MTIIKELFPAKTDPIYKRIDTLFEEVRGFLAWNKSPNYSFVYDQVVCYGELMSSSVLSAYLNSQQVKNEWLDVRTCIKTGNVYRDAIVDWDLTCSSIIKQIDSKKLYVTQGFIGSDENNFTTTLGREGSDYSAAILAYCLDATSVTIWKDVPGVLNADPRYFENAELLKSVSYREAIELAFYGASVIHPKTLQPLQRKEIPLHVKSFIAPKEEGTTVGKGKGIHPKVPCFIVKKDQVLMKLSSLDFSFIVEDSMSELFKLFHKYRTKVELIQNSAISFSVCIDNKFKKLDDLLLELKNKYNVVVTKTFHCIPFVTSTNRQLNPSKKTKKFY